MNSYFILNLVELESFHEDCEKYLFLCSLAQNRSFVKESRILITANKDNYCKIKNSRINCSTNTNYS